MAADLFVFAQPMKFPNKTKKARTKFSVSKDLGDDGLVVISKEETEGMLANEEIVTNALVGEVAAKLGFVKGVSDRKDEIWSTFDVKQRVS
jgi:hypothetical protein